MRGNSLAKWETDSGRGRSVGVESGLGLGQLVTALGKHGTTNRWHEQFGYGYDAAYNLTKRTNNALVQTFVSNGANELTSAASSGTITVAGATTLTPFSVTVNGSTANVTLYADKTFAATGRPITNSYTALATTPWPNSLIAQSIITPNLGASVTLTYDGNGNLLSDGLRGFEYDDENQLIRVTATNQWKSEFVYDGLGRLRVRKEYVSLLADTGNYWFQSASNRYVYDGRLVPQDRDGYNTARVSYTRGLDLSGTREGAGGIGGGRAGAGGTASARVDGDGLGEAAQDGRGEGKSGGAVACGDGDYTGVDCGTVANGMPVYAGQLPERATNSPIAGTDTNGA